MMPSTPRSRRRLISAGSSMVQTWTWRPSWWAYARKAASTTLTGPERTGTWAATTAPVQPRGRDDLRKRDNEARRRRVTARWPIDVAIDGPARARAVARRASLKDARRTRDEALHFLITSTAGATTPAALRSMLKWMSGQADRVSSRRGTAPAPATRILDRSVQVMEDTAPGVPVSRVKVASWKITGTPRAVRGP